MNSDVILLSKLNLIQVEDQQIIEHVQKHDFSQQMNFTINHIEIYEVSS